MNLRAPAFVEALAHTRITRYIKKSFSETKNQERFSPFLLQGSEVLLEGRADLAQQLHQRMTQEAGIGWLGVEGVGSRSVMHAVTLINITLSGQLQLLNRPDW